MNRCVCSARCPVATEVMVLLPARSFRGIDGALRGPVCCRQKRAFALSEHASDCWGGGGQFAFETEIDTGGELRVAPEAAACPHSWKRGQVETRLQSPETTAAVAAILPETRSSIYYVRPWFNA